MRAPWQGACPVPGPERYLLAALCAWLALGCGTASNDAPAAAAGDTAAELAIEETAGSPTPARPVVLFVGTSLTAGAGLTAEQSFPALVQRRIDEAGLAYRVVNAGVSGDTSAGGLRRIEWLLRLPVAVMILELGANDMLRGQSAAMMRDNLRSILDLTLEAMPDVQLVIAGMRAAPNLGAAYAREFDSVFPQLATEYDAALIPFLLEGVASVRGLNQPDGIHPTADGHEILANTVWQVLAPLLRTPEESLSR